MHSIREAGNLTGQKVFVRVDWNVPIKDGQIQDDFRIKETLPTLSLLKLTGAEVSIATHLEPETAPMEALSNFVPEGMKLLPNLRKHWGETLNTREFARELAGGFDLYVNEAFGVSHREHASIVRIPEILPSYCGLRFEKEVEELSKAFNPSRPFLFILGGAKFETKIPLVEKFLNIADQIAIFGAIAKPAFDTSLKSNPKVVFPLGDIAALDADEANINLLREKISQASFVLWNGPLGKYEDGYTQGTKALAQLLADSGKVVIVGGGDTLTAIKELGLHDKFTFVSTGGGAMLDFLANGTLPGIEALN